MIARKSRGGWARAAGNTTKPSRAGNAPPSALSEDEIFARIYDAVLDHRLQPGTKLKEVALAEAFGVNRAVVRKVLARLSYNRLVALRPNRGAVVASPTIEESRDLFAARRVVEAGIVECVARKASRADVKALRTLAQHEHEAYDRGDAAAAVAAMNAHLSSLEGQLDLTEAPPPAPDFAALFAVSEA